MPATPKSAWVGLDWSHSALAVVAVDRDGKKLLSFEVANDKPGFDQLLLRLSDFEVSGVAIETRKGLIVQHLIEKGIPVYHVNPKVSKSWRNCYAVSPSKSDPLDAFALADGLRIHKHWLEPITLDTDSLRLLRGYCEDEVSLIDEQTACVLKLKACLKSYFPVLLKWFGNWKSMSALEFLLLYSSPEKLARASKSNLRAFLRRHRIGYTKPVWHERIENRGRDAWTGDAVTIEVKARRAIALARQLVAIKKELRIYRSKIESLFREHPDAPIFASLPGAGPKLAPRLLCMFGSDRTRYRSASSLQRLSGVVPIQDTSGDGPARRRAGKQPRARFRWACRKALRQTMHLFAHQAKRQSAWSRAYYDGARKSGQSMPQALRNLAAKWLKIIFRMWQTREPYDEERYVAALKRRSSPLAARLAA